MTHLSKKSLLLGAVACVLGNGASNPWVNWSGVKALQHRGQYGVCAQGSFSLPSDSLFFPDGPNSCSMGTQPRWPASNHVS